MLDGTVRIDTRRGWSGGYSGELWFEGGGKDGSSQVDSGQVYGGWRDGSVHDTVENDLDGKRTLFIVWESLTHSLTRTNIDDGRYRRREGA